MNNLVRNSFLGLLIVSSAQTASSQAAVIPACEISGDLSDTAVARYSYHKNEFSWLTFEFDVAGIQTTGLTLKPGLTPFIEINVKKLKDGTPDIYFSSMLYVGEATSNGSGELVTDWVSTVTFGDQTSTFDQMNFRSSYGGNPDFVTRFGGVGGRTTAPEDFVAGLREGRDLSFSAFNSENPAETLAVSLDMEDARRYFDIMEQQDAIIRQQVAEGTCAPV